MATISLVRHLGSLFEDGSASGLSDRQLLERVTAPGGPPDEAAFSAIVSRHGPMVLSVCRQLLGDAQHAEDAFQATFLVLARRVRSIRDPDALGPWLYGVALRVARKARAKRDHRKRTEERAAVIRPEARSDHPADQAIGREHAEALHREIERLPRTFRAPVVLCYLEGLSPDEAARRLRCPGGTLRSRLVRARERLRRGLLRRGVVLSGAAIAGALAPRPAEASVPPLLCDSTTRAAIAFAARHAAGGPLSAPAAELAREVLKTMTIHKLTTAAISVCLAAAVATGILAARPTTPKEGPAQTPAAPRPNRPDPAPPGRMTITGRVLRPDNQPAAGVPVEIIAAPRTPPAEADAARDAFIVLGRGESGADGRFRIDAARSSSSRFADVHALAGAAPGSGFGSAPINPDAEQPTAEIHLPPEQVVRGKLVDIQGQPAAGVAVQLNMAFPEAPGANFDPPSLGHNPSLIGSPEGLQSWPKPAVTDAQGRFALGGIGRGLSLWLTVSDPRFARDRIVHRAVERDTGRDLTLALQPATIIEGRVLAADTGRPVADALIAVRASTGPLGAMFTTQFHADGEGRFRVNPSVGDYFRVKAIPAQGQPYLAAGVEFGMTKGAVKKEIALKLPRGASIRGTVTEQGTGRPVADARLRFMAVQPDGSIATGNVTAGDDGSYRLTVPPGRGYLFVLAPTLDDIPKEIASGRVFGRGRDTGIRYYAHDIIEYEVKAGDPPREVNAAPRRGATIRGRLVGPDGETVEDAVVLTRQQFDPINLTWQGQDSIHARDGRFELSGFDPEKPMPAYFLDAARGWGAAMAFSGKPAGEERTVRLQPCGQARMRFVGPDGRPVAKLGIIPYVSFVMTPGPVPRRFTEGDDALTADVAYLPNIDSSHYPNTIATGADGRITLPALIPGATYRVVDWSTVNTQGKGIQLRKDFTVQPGETIDLGDILVEKP